MEPRAPKRRIKKKVWRKVSRIAPQKSGTLGINCRVFIANLHWQGGSWSWWVSTNGRPWLTTIPFLALTPTTPTISVCGALAHLRTPWLTVVGEVILCYCWWKKSGDHHLGCIQPCKQWNRLPLNCCRISSINSSTWTVGWDGKMIHTPRKKVSKCWVLQAQNVFSRSPHLRSDEVLVVCYVPSGQQKRAFSIPFLVDRCWKVSPKKVPSAAKRLIFFCGAEV